jgi:hypothetical protein
VSCADDAAAAALARIAGHISNPAKFSKASALLRQLLEREGRPGGALRPGRRGHGWPLFLAVRAAFRGDDPGARAASPELRREFGKLVGAVAAAAPALRAGMEAEQAQLQVYYLWAVEQVGFGGARGVLQR